MGTPMARAPGPARWHNPLRSARAAAQRCAAGAFDARARSSSIFQAIVG